MDLERVCIFLQTQRWGLDTGDIHHLLRHCYIVPWPLGFARVTKTVFADYLSPRHCYPPMKLSSTFMTWKLSPIPVQIDLTCWEAVGKLSPGDVPAKTSIFLSI